MTRRDLLKRFGTMTAAAIALPIDLDKLIWVPKPIITVPARMVTIPRSASVMMTLMAPFPDVFEYRLVEGRKILVPLIPYIYKMRAV